MTPLIQAEQAVLGSVLLDPGQLGHLSPWLRPEHFYRPAHAALYAAMVKLRADGHPATTGKSGDPIPLSWVTDTVREAGTLPHGLTASYAHSLISACPRATHVPVYGRMVLEGAIHRSVTQHAVRLHRAARTDAVRGGVDETVHHAQALAEVLADLAHRWGTEPRPVQPPSPNTSPLPAGATGRRTGSRRRGVSSRLYQRPARATARRCPLVASRRLGGHRPSADLPSSGRTAPPRRTH
ncbi:DnaB-like helicase N-terminal domain-containing protein [Streptomyces sp. NPDC002763]|uniref:DnaB-like helicase N-terminal domain-containing protein n=1 Tax=Streptomyces sp. NPDC002763 TaxID=3154427 RepID=UPI00331F02D9